MKMQCLLRSQISLKPGGCSRLSPDSASMGEGKGWMLLEETVTSCLRKEVPCLALVRESQSKRYEGKYLPSVLARTQENSKWLFSGQELSFSALFLSASQKTKQRVKVSFYLLPCLICRVNASTCFASVSTWLTQTDMICALELVAWIKKSAGEV